MGPQVVSVGGAEGVGNGYQLGLADALVTLLDLQPLQKHIR